MKSLSDYIKEFFITEMSIKLGEFRKKNEGIINQVIENWCLVKWCDDNPNELTSKSLRNHWASELIGHMKSIVNTKLKSGRKDKALKNLMIDTMELDDIAVVSRIIRDKFNKEGLSKYVNKMSFECSKHIEEICSVLSGTEEDVEEYIKGEIS